MGHREGKTEGKLEEGCNIWEKNKEKKKKFVFTVHQLGSKHGGSVKGIISFVKFISKATDMHQLPVPEKQIISELET